MTVKEILGLMFDSIDSLEKSKSHPGKSSSTCAQCLGEIMAVYLEKLRNAYEADELI